MMDEAPLIMNESFAVINSQARRACLRIDMRTLAEPSQHNNQFKFAYEDAVALVLLLSNVVRGAPCKRVVTPCLSFINQ